MGALRALFSGRDASGNVNLWVTDGTWAGTRELTVAANLGLLAFFNRESLDFTVLGSKALFRGDDGNLWVPPAELAC